jgi:hypothetical protein
MAPRFDAQRIDYRHDTSRSYEKDNALVCAALNAGTRFTVVFVEPSYQRRIRQRDLHYALVVLPDRRKLPYPLFQEATDTFFMLKRDVLLVKFESWMREQFPTQFMGTIEARSRELRHQRDAIAAAVQLAQGERVQTYDR